MNREELEKNAEAQREFFDNLAPSWRETGAPDEKKLIALLSQIPLKEGERVLDVACGSGILDGVLLSMGLKTDAVDISQKMIEKARRNPRNAGANYFVADFYSFREEIKEEEKYDYILVFDSYPHFPDKRLFGEKAASLLREKGFLWIFFDQSKESINSRHSPHGGSVSTLLKSAKEEAEGFKDLFNVVFLLDNAEGYYIGLMKK